MNTLSDTAGLILGVFSEHGIRKKYSLSIFDLLFKKSQWDQHHQENFTRALNELIDWGFIDWGERHVLILTEEGYDALSHQDKFKTLFK